MNAMQAWKAAGDAIRKAQISSIKVILKAQMDAIRASVEKERKHG